MGNTFEEPDPAFAEELGVRLAVKPNKTARERRILEILNGRDTRRKRRIVARMERHAAAELGVPVAEIDWSAVDWAKVLTTILKVLIMLLPLLI